MQYKQEITTYSNFNIPGLEVKPDFELQVFNNGNVYFFPVLF